MRHLRLTLAALLAAVTVSACAPNAQNTQASIAQERQAAERFVGQLRAKDKLVTDRNLNSYVSGIVQRVAKQRPPGSVPLKTYIVKEADVNAFTPGGGYVFFNAGMLAAMENEAQLASVAAHEIAHIDRGHITAGRNTRTGVQVGAAAASIAGALLGVPGQVTDLAVGLGANYAVNSFSRSQETDADNTGITYLAGAGYNALEGAKSFDVLQRLYGNRAGPAAAFFSSHPPSAERKANLSARARALGATKGRIAGKTYDSRTRKIRREVLKVYESNGRNREAAQIRRNLR